MFRIACLHIPGLAVQAVMRERFGAGVNMTLALVDGPDGHSDKSKNSGQSKNSGKSRPARVVACTALAADCGVRPGQALAAARGTCPELVVVEHDPGHTREALEVVADALGAFGPVVSLAPPESVLVDTTGVCGVDTRGARLLEVANELGFTAHVAVASTPFAALALASHGAFQGPAEPQPGQEETRAVGRLPLVAARLQYEAWHALHVVGIRTVGAFMALPAVSLARRFGPEVRRTWRQAHGRATFALDPYDPERPVVERSRHDEAPLENLEPVTFALKRLVDRSLTRLQGRALGIEEVVITFGLQAFGPEPGHTPAGTPELSHTLTMTLGHPMTDATLLMQLFRERLSHSPPPGPVIFQELLVSSALPLAPTQLSLFGDPAPRETIQTTVARLAAIVGGERRFMPQLREDFRPELAWELVPFELGARERGRAPAVNTRALPPGPRPTRLLREPAHIDGLSGPGPPPGAVSGPERLVTGWWDQNPIARDYWVVSDRWGRRTWVFRELASRSWFIHGHFD